MKKKHMGIFLIFNQMEFSPTGKLANKPRNGSDIDERALRKAMKSLGFEVHSYLNLKTKQIRGIIRKYAASQDHQYSNSFGLAFFSHGDKQGNLCTFDGEINLDELVEPFIRQTYLVGKPKLFFIQACRNEYTDGYDDGVPVRYVTHSKSSDIPEKWPTYADILYVFATIVDYRSFRKSEEGSWLIQALAEKINQYGKTKEFHLLLTRVNKSVALKKAKITDKKTEETIRSKQISEFKSTLTKELCFGDFEKSENVERKAPD